MINRSEADFDALAEMQVRWEQAAKTAENLPIMKFSRALERARARRSSSPAERDRHSRQPSITLPTVITPERFEVAMASPLTDAEVRGRLLKHFYGLRDVNGGWVPTSEIILSPDPVSRQAIANACQHLAEAGYIRWEPFNPPIEQHAIGRAKISGTGIDVITGAREPTIDICFPGMGERGMQSALASAATLSGAISAEGRRVRFEQWEKLGLDRVKADLANGGHQIIGGPPAVRELAWEWVRIKEAEATSATSATSQPTVPIAPASEEPLSDAALTEIRDAIAEIKNQLPAISASNVRRAEIDSDLAQINTELERPTPRRKFLKVCLESLRDNLAKAAGAAVAGLISTLALILAKHFGLF